MSSMADVGCVTRDRSSGLNLYLCLFTNKSSSLNVVNRVNYWRGGSVVGEYERPPMAKTHPPRTTSTSETEIWDGIAQSNTR